MKKYLLIVVLIANSFPNVLGQSPSITSKIVDENGKGIPYATIGIIEKGYGVVAFEDGSFTLPIKDRYKEDFLLVSALGFEQKKIFYPDFVKEKPLSIVLTSSPLFLDEITITPAKLIFSKLGVPNRKSRNNFAISSPLKGATIAMRFDEFEEPVLLKEVSVVVGQKNLDTFQLRCRIFRVNEETGMPGEDLMQQNLISTGKKKSEKISFSLGDDFWVDEPFFIGFEWISTKEQFQQMQEAQKEFPTDFIDEIVKENQRPGLTMSINESKRVRFHDSTNSLVKEVELSKAQTKVLKSKDKQAPTLKFKVLSTGKKTFYGSPIIGKWALIPHEALISISIAKEER